MDMKEVSKKSNGGQAEPFSTTLPEGLVIRTIMNNSYDTLYFKDLNSKFILNSQAHAIQFGVPEARLMLGKDDSDYFPEAFAQATREDELRIMASGEPMIGHVEKWFRPDGGVSWLMASKYPLYDAEGAVIGTWGTSRDITPLKEAEEELERLNHQLQEANSRLEILSIRDSLSGLYNHRHFFETLNFNAAYDSRQKECGCHNTFSILLLDIDYFKTINDTYGHLSGDIVIRNIGAKLTESTRSSDACFRYGGDEFALILAGTGLEDARLLADKLRVMISEMPMESNTTVFHITASIGVACYSEAGSISELIHIADERLYLSKAEGRNRIR